MPGVVSDYGPRCFGVARDEPRSVGDRVGVSLKDSLVLIHVVLDSINITNIIS